MAEKKKRFLKLGRPFGELAHWLEFFNVPERKMAGLYEEAWLVANRVREERKRRDYLEKPWSSQRVAAEVIMRTKHHFEATLREAIGCEAYADCMNYLQCYLETGVKREERIRPSTRARLLRSVSTREGAQMMLVAVLLVQSRSQYQEHVDLLYMNMCRSFIEAKDFLGLSRLVKLLAKRGSKWASGRS